MNADNAISTAEAQEDFVRNVAPLMIWHAWYLSTRKESPVSPMEALDKYVDLYRLTVYNDKNLNPAWTKDFSDPNWDILKQKIVEVFNAHTNALNSQNIESLCMEFLWPLLEAKLYKDRTNKKEDQVSPYRCWKYEVVDDFIVLHIANAVQPDSPFTDMRRLSSDLLRLLKDAKVMHPHQTRVRCVTWLNGLPVFLKLFPDIWSATLTTTKELGSGLGIWGQYIDRRGAFNHKNGQKFRETGHHPFFLVAGQCGYDEAVDHLSRTIF